MRARGAMLLLAAGVALGAVAVASYFLVQFGPIFR